MQRTKTTPRRKTHLVSYKHAADPEDIEYFVVRVKRFFAAEHIHTVFPDALSCEEQLQCRFPDRPVHAYLIFTFQPGRGALQARREEDVLSDAETVRSVARDHGEALSSLIAYTPESSEWKDESREIFFNFMKQFEHVVRDNLPTEAADECFIDWPDPATGMPMRSTRGPSNFTDVAATEEFFSFDTILVAGAGGGCRMMEHPIFGLNVYVAAGVMVLPEDAEPFLQEALENWAPSL